MHTLTGKCPIGDRLTAVSDKLSAGCHSFSERSQHGGCGTHSGDEAGESAAAVSDDLDPVDEAAMESFPASDSPSYSSGTATPSQPIQ